MGDESERAAFVRAICAEPACDTARLVYADWLDEHGELERAEFVRVQVELARLPDPCPRCECANLRTAAIQTRGAEQRELCALHARERELLQPNWALWMPEVPGPRGCGNRDCFPKTGFAAGGSHTVMTFRRGFVEEITCTAADFLKHADALVWHPGMTDKCPTCVGMGDLGTLIGRHGCYTCAPNHTTRGSGYVPRPCPLTAHPIRKVVLTTRPQFDSAWLGVNWPGIEFALPT